MPTKCMGFTHHPDKGYFRHTISDSGKSHWPRKQFNYLHYELLCMYLFILTIVPTARINGPHKEVQIKFDGDSHPLCFHFWYCQGDQEGSHTHLGRGSPHAMGRRACIYLKRSSLKWEEPSNMERMAWSRNRILGKGVRCRASFLRATL